MYVKDHGQFPAHNSGVVPYAPEDEPITWSGINMCLTNGFRGQKAGQTLSMFIADKFKITNKSNAKNYSEKLISDWIEIFYNDHGHYPTKRSGKVDYGKDMGYLFTTWSAIDACLSKGHRGLPGGSTLSNFVKSQANRDVKFKFWYQ
jgi:hypothetical protein